MTELRDIASVSVRRPVLMAVINLLIIVAGLTALFGIEVRELPDVDRPIVTVQARLPGASPETVDAELTSRLEAAVARVNGVRLIRSQSEETSTRIVIEFRPNIDLDSAASEVREAVSRAQRRLPEAVERVTVIKADSDAQGVINLAISSPTLSREALTRRVETDISPALLAIDGVAEVSLRGDREQVLRIAVDPLKMNAAGVSINEVRAAIAAAPFDIPTGNLRSTDQQLIVRADATADRADLVEAIIVKDQTRVGDVARVYFGPADAESFVRLDGDNVISAEVIRQARSNTIEISDRVQRIVAQLRSAHPDLVISITTDDAQFIRSSVSEVLNTLMLTVVLVVLTLWLFIGSFRTTLVPALSIPVALIGSVALIWMLGYSINILTLLALVLATGLIVDDAIVVVENIQRKRAQGLGRRAAAVLGTREVFFAVVATTAVLAAVFLPIAFMPSQTGRLFREFGAVLAGAVVISSLVALTLVPAFTAKLPKRDNQISTRLHQSLKQFGLRVGTFYQNSLDTLFNRPALTLVISSIFIGAVVWVAPQIEQSLLPDEDRGVIRIFATGPDGVGLNFMDRQAIQMERIVAPHVESGEVNGLLTVVGQWDMNRVLITAPLADWSERDRSARDLINELQAPLASIPGAPARVWSSNSLNLRGQGGGFEFAVSGEHYDAIYQEAQKLANYFQDASLGITNLRVEYQPTQPQVRVIIDRPRASQLNVRLADIALALRVATTGDDVADLNVGDQSIPIYLRVTQGSVQSPNDLSNLYVSSANGRAVPLSELVTLKEEGVAAELERYGQRRAIRVQGDLEGISLDTAVTLVRGYASEQLPSEFGVMMLGEAANLDDNNNQVTLTYALALLVVFLVLAAQFENINSAVVVMLTIPFGVAAALLSLYLTNTSLNIYSQIGLVMLIGLIAKNAILIVEFADQLRDRGFTVNEAVISAANQRLRPIMMTMLSTILGSVPLILSTGAGSEARNAIGWVVFGGLGITTLFTLYLTPIFYRLTARFSKARSSEQKALADELLEAKQFD